MSDIKALKKDITKTLRALDALFDQYIIDVVKLGHEIGRPDILGKRKVLDAVHLEIIRGLPSAHLKLLGSVRKSTAKLPG